MVVVVPAPLLLIPERAPMVVVVVVLVAVAMVVEVAAVELAVVVLEVWGWWLSLSPPVSSTPTSTDSSRGGRECWFHPYKVC